MGNIAILTGILVLLQSSIVLILIQSCAVRCPSHCAGKGLHRAVESMAVRSKTIAQRSEPFAQRSKTLAQPSMMAGGRQPGTEMLTRRSGGPFNP